MARWKARVEFLLSVIELLFIFLTVEELQGKMCQNSLPSGGGGSVKKRPPKHVLKSSKLASFAQLQFMSIFNKLPILVKICPTDIEIWTLINGLKSLPFPEACFLKPRLHDTTCCHTGCQTGLYNPVWQPCWTNIVTFKVQSKTANDSHQSSNTQHIQHYWTSLTPFDLFNITLHYIIPEPLIYASTKQRSI